MPVTQIARQLPWKKFFKFLVTGGSALAIDFGIYFLLTRYADLHYLLARTISLAIAIGWNFGLNRYWTFQAAAGKASAQFIRFLAVIIATSILQIALMWVGVALLGLYDLLVIIVVAALITAINFAAHHFWTYANRHKEEGEKREEVA